LALDPQTTMTETHPPTLLLVDDEENILSALKRLLRREGYRILTSATPEGGLAILDGEPVDVVVSDQRMPSMSGTEFLRRVKTRHPDTVRLVLSGYTELQSVTDAINEGAIYKFLTKPWDDELLVANIREAFQRHAMKNENVRLARELEQTNARLSEANAELQRLLEARGREAERVEAALDTTQEVLQLIPWPILGVDADGMIALANSVAENLLHGGHNLLGLPARDVLPAELVAGMDSATRPPEVVMLHGCRYSTLCRPMGWHSDSRGRLLALLPEEACR
jgi:FixJ family two-component response regulator